MEAGVTKRKSEENVGLQLEQNKGCTAVGGKAFSLPQEAGEPQQTMSWMTPRPMSSFPELQ